MTSLLVAHTLYVMYKKKHEQIEHKNYSLDPDVLRFFHTGDETNDRVAKGKKIDFVNFLPAEVQMGHDTNSLTTITFFTGDYRKIEKKLERRVNDVLKMNPWLGGRIVVKPGDDKVRLWYDLNCVDVPPNIYTCHEPGIIPLKRSTKYAQYKHCLSDHNVVVPCVGELIGKNNPFWKVNVVPDAAQKDDRFAIVVSQSHMIGDAHTYYRIFNMLLNSNSAKTQGLVNTAPVEKLNPNRKQDVQYHIENHRGVQEASYIRKTKMNVIDEVYEKVASSTGRKKQTMVFTVSKTWLKRRMEECIAAKNEEEQSECRHQSSDLVGIGRDHDVSLDISHQGESSSPETMKSTTASSENAPEGPVDTRERSSQIKLGNAATPAADSSFDDSDCTEHIHATDVLLSWWFRISNADIGLYPHPLRNVLTVLSEVDAGNYNTQIPFTKPDYQTPQQIHRSIVAGKRVPSSAPQKPLRSITTGYSFAVGVDWDRLYTGQLLHNDLDNCDESIYDDSDCGGDDGIVQTLHIPFFRDVDLNVMGARTNTCLIFTAKHGKQSNERQIGMLLVASKAICKKVVRCGIIDEDLDSRYTADIVADIDCGDGDHQCSAVNDFNPVLTD